MSPRSFRYLSQEQVVEAGGLDLSLALEAVTGQFRARQTGAVIEGPLSKIDIDPQHRSRLIAHTAYVGLGSPVGGVKWIPGHKDNPPKGLPRAIATLILTDPSDASPLAIMDGTLISLSRTAASAALGAQLLARGGARSLALIGAGVCNRVVLRAMREALPGIGALRVFDIDREAAELLLSREEELLTGFDSATIASSARDAMLGADIVVLATDDAVEPYVESEWLAEGSLLIALSLQDAKPQTVLDSDLVVTTDRASLATGLTIPGRLSADGSLDPRAPVELGEVLVGAHPGRRSDRDRVYYDCWGLGATDLAVAQRVLQRALDERIGVDLPLWNEPHEVLGLTRPGRRSPSSNSAT